jgi:phosphate transport system permease protein
LTRSLAEQTMDKVNAGLKRRYRAERRFRMYGLVSIGIAMLFLAILLTDIVGKGASAFKATYIGLDVFLDPAEIDPEGTRDPDQLARADYTGLLRAALAEEFPEIDGRKERRERNALVSSGSGFMLQKMVRSDPDLIGQTVRVWVPADDEIDMLRKGYIDRDLPEGDRRVSDLQIDLVDRLEAAGQIESRFNRTFFSNADSRDPEQAGIWGAVKGSFYTLIVTLALSFPIGVAAAVYLEEFAPKNKLTDLIEVNINNLAAVPSIVFGLLGLAVFLNFFQLPRSAPFVGGLVLTLMTLPTIIISSRAALKSVPPSIREAALGMGASKVQTTFHHTVPLALPGMLTGTIIGMAQALGETAPLLMIGMIAFIVDVPQGFFDPSTVLPVQVYLWADSPERAFVEKTSAAIMVLLAFLLAMNLLAVFLRRKFERRW